MLSAAGTVKIIPAGPGYGAAHIDHRSKREKLPGSDRSGARRKKSAGSQTYTWLKERPEPGHTRSKRKKRGGRLPNVQLDKEA